MENLQRDFKGIWIPKEVWLDERLNALDKIILMEVYSLDNGDIGCYASNKYFAIKLGVSKRTISEALSSLEKMNYIEIKYDDSKRKIYNKVWNSTSRGMEENFYTPIEKNFYHNINNKNIKKNIYNNTKNMPQWFDNNINIKKPTEEEQKELDKLLKEFN